MFSVGTMEVYSSITGQKNTSAVGLSLHTCNQASQMMYILSISENIGNHTTDKISLGMVKFNPTYIPGDEGLYYSVAYFERITEIDAI